MPFALRDLRQRADAVVRGEPEQVLPLPDRSVEEREQLGHRARRNGA